MIRQELNPVTCKLDEKQIKAGTSMSAPIDITGNWWVSLLVPVSSVPPAPPALLLEGERTEGRKKREVLHLFRCYTHTHPAGAGSTLKGKRKKKADTNDGQRAKTAQGGGGEQADLQNQPTRRNGPDQNSAHTSTPRHITERHAGRIRDQMGD